MGRVKIRYLVAKKQKGHTLYYWQPTKALREAGFLPRRLAEGFNTLHDAIREAEVLNAELDAWRVGHPPELASKEGTIPWLVHHYQQSEKYQNLATKTQSGYDQCFKVIEAWSAEKGHPDISGITPLAVEKFYKTMSKTPHQAAAVIRVLRLLLNRAVKFRLIDYNPASKPEIKTPPPRHQVWEGSDIKSFVEAAEEQGRRSMGLAVMLAAHLGQREGDVLRIAWGQYDGECISLRQRKTGKPLAVPVTGELKRFLDMTPRKSTQMVVSETTKKPYAEDNFRHVFRKIADGVALTDLQFRDLRRTAAVRLAEAGCSAPEIAAITGHNIETTQMILETYVPRTTLMARSAIAKLEANKIGSKLEG